jgi:hypothetical protein
LEIRTLHQPERLADETLDAYHARLRWSRVIAAQVRVVTALPMQHRTDAMRRWRRQRVKQIGIRQLKRQRRVVTEIAREVQP